MTKITLDRVGNLADVSTAGATINANFDTIGNSFDNTLSRDGDSPNEMHASLDMNSHQILNLPAPISNSSPLRLQELSDFIGGTSGILVPAGGGDGQVLTKRSNTSFDVDWENIPGETFNLKNYTVADGSTDDFAGITACITAAVAASGTILVPDATYAHSGSINWGFNNLKVIAQGSHAKFQHLGSGIAHNFDGLLNYPGSQGCVGGVFGGPNRITLSGNTAGGTTQVVVINNWHFGDMKVSIRNGNTCLSGTAAVCTVFDVRISNNTDGAFAVQPRRGVDLSFLFSCKFNNLVVEGCGATGQPSVVLSQAVHCEFNGGGTVESGNAGGVLLDNLCDKNTFINFDSEVNGTGYDWDIRGTNNLFVGCGASGTTIGSSLSGNYNIFENCGFQSLTIQSGAANNRLIHCYLNTSFTDGGTNTTILSASGGLGIADKVPFAGTVSNIVSKNGLTSFSAINTATGTDSRAGLALGNSIGSSEMGIGGTSYATNPLLQNRVYFLAGAASDGIALQTSAADPILFAVNNTEAGRFSATGQFILPNGSSSGVYFKDSGGATDGQVYEGAAGTLNVKMGSANGLNITKNDATSVMDYSVTNANKVTVTPPLVLGSTINGNTLTPGTATLTGGAGKTLTYNNSLTLAGTDGTTQTFPTTSASIARTDAAQTFTGTQTFSSTISGNISGNAAGNAATASTVSGIAAGIQTWWNTPTSANLKAAVTDETGSGALVFANSPALITPTGIVKGDVGLGNVDNTSDTTKNATVAALTNKDLTSGTNTFPTFNQNTTGSAAKLTTARTIDGQSFDGTANITVIAPGIHAAAAKTTPVDADEFAIVDTAASNVLKKLTWANLKATLGANRAVVNVAPADPTGTTSTTGVMMGLGGSGCSITPANTGRVRFTICGTLVNNTAGVSSQVRMSYGTSTAPTNGAASTGTFFGNSSMIATGGGSGVGISIPFSITGIATGLTAGTPYWFDLRVGAVTSGTASVSALNCIAEEI